MLFDTLTGELIEELNPLDASWSVGVNEPEDVEASFDLNDPDVRDLDLRNLATPWKTCLAMRVGTRWYGGPIQEPAYTSDSGELTLKARGIGSYFRRRLVLPPSAETGSLVMADGMPNPAFDTTISNVDLGTIAKRLVEQACAWSGAGLPVTYEADRVGAATRTYVAVDFKNLGEALDDLTQVVNGPDIRFELRETGVNSFGWFMRTGTEGSPRLTSPTIHSWDLGADDPAASGLVVDVDPSRMADIQWGAAGRDDDRVMVARARSTSLRDAGFPLMEDVDTSRTNISEQATLNGYANEALRVSGRAAQFWSFDARPDMAPFPDEYWPGDDAELVVERDPWIPDGVYQRRISALSGDLTGPVQVTLGEVFDG